MSGGPSVQTYLSSIRQGQSMGKTAVLEESQFAQASDMALRSTEILSAAERQHILVDWNATQAPYPQNKCLHELFEEQVERNPRAIAVVHADQHVSYEDLNQRANRLAHYLR